MGQSWDRKAAGWVSDAIPNEMSKTNSFAKYLQYIPYVGTALKAIWNTGSAADRFGETYSNDGNLMDSAQYGMSAYQDTAGDPNKYSPKNDSFSSGDGWLKAGKIGEALPGSKTDYGSVGRGANLGKSILTKENSHQSERGPGSKGYNSNSFDMSSMGNMFGGQQGQQGGQGGGMGMPTDIFSSVLGGGNKDSSEGSKLKADQVMALMNMFNKQRDDREKEVKYEEKKSIPSFTTNQGAFARG